MESIEILVVEPNEDDRQFLKSILKDDSFTVSFFESAEALIIHMIKNTPSLNQKRCFLINQHLPGMSGHEAFLQLRKLEPNLSVVFMSHKPSVSTVLALWKAGATDFLTYPFSSAELLLAVSKAANQKQPVRQIDEIGVINSIKADYEKLTPRERVVLQLVSKGYKNQRIGFELGISLPTVKMHRANLMRKVQKRSIAELVSFYNQCVRFVL